jgi:hypothetical protein
MDKTPARSDEPRAILGLRAALERERRRRDFLSEHLPKAPIWEPGGLQVLLGTWTEALDEGAMAHNIRFRQAVRRGRIVDALTHRGALKPWAPGQHIGLRAVNGLAEAHAAVEALPAIIEILTRESRDELLDTVERDAERGRPARDWRTHPAKWWIARHLRTWNRALAQILAALTERRGSPLVQMPPGTANLRIVLLDSDPAFASLLREQYATAFRAWHLHATSRTSEVLNLLRAHPRVQVVLIGSTPEPSDGIWLAQRVVRTYGPALVAIGNDPDARLGIVALGGHDGQADVRSGLLDELIDHVV